VRVHNGFVDQGQPALTEPFDLPTRLWAAKAAGHMELLLKAVTATVEAIGHRSSGLPQARERLIELSDSACLWAHEEPCPNQDFGRRAITTFKQPGDWARGVGPRRLWYRKSDIVALRCQIGAGGIGSLLSHSWGSMKAVGGADRSNSQSRVQAPE